jgi:hypothetical protein
MNEKITNKLDKYLELSDTQKKCAEQIMSIRKEYEDSFLKVVEQDKKLKTKPKELLDKAKKLYPEFKEAAVSKSKIESELIKELKVQPKEIVIVSQIYSIFKKIGFK